MRKFTKRISALLVFLAAAVMTISAAGVSAFATPAPEPDDGWRKTDDGWVYWFYSTRHTPRYYCIENMNFKVDGILYSFDENGICTGKCSGLMKESGTKRRYYEGIPYTGWTKNKSDDSRKYYLDGYPVTGDLPIDGKVYSFDENGVYTGKSIVPVLTADCGEKISSDTEKFRITVTAHDEEGNFYAAGDPVRMERWEKGQWVDCIGDGVEYSRSEEMAAINGIEGECFPNYDIVEFEPQKYTNSNFNYGYYRLVFTYWEGSGDGMVLSDKEFYAVFRVVPPVEVRMSKEIYTADEEGNVDVCAYIDINSEKHKTPESISSIKWEVLKLGKRNWVEFIPEASYEEGCDSIDSDGTISIDISSSFETGSYLMSITIDGSIYNWYYTMFRVDKA